MSDGNNTTTDPKPADPLAAEVLAGLTWLEQWVAPKPLYVRALVVAATMGLGWLLRHYGIPFGG